MRVAFAGKGGAGKSVIAGTLARLLAAEGEPVLAVDSDPLPGLAISMGVDVGDAALPDEAVVEAPEGERPRFRLRPDLLPVDAVHRFAATGPDGVRFLQFGKPRGHVAELARSQFAFRQILAGLGRDHWHVVGDLPGGTRQPFFGWGDYASLILVVAEPTAASLLSARRLGRLARAERAPRLAAVVSKAAGPDDAQIVAQRTGLEVVGVVPHDDDVLAAERAGVPLVDHAPDSVAVGRIRLLLQALRDEEASP